VCCGLLRPLRDAARKAVDVPIVKIDDAMAEYVAARASRIGVLATVPTTLGPTADLIRAHATGLGRDVCSVVR
jgi:aspartate/glutamate racemase